VCVEKYNLAQYSATGFRGTLLLLKTCGGVTLVLWVP